MPRAHTRLYALGLLTFAVACRAPSPQRMTDRESVAESGVLVDAAAPAGSATSTDSTIETTVAAVTNDVDSLRAASPTAAAARLPAHERLVSGMLSTFETRIRAMHVQADPSWTSVIDSVRTDLVRLPAMSPPALAAFLPQHLNRVMRIVACIQMVKG